MATVSAEGDQPSRRALIEKPFGAAARITLDKTAEYTPEQQRWIEAFIARYNARTGKSKRFSQDNRKVMADPRVVTGFNPLWKDLVYPIVVDRSKGAHLWDLDGNQYIDLLSCFGANLLGYQPDELLKAMVDQLHAGIEVGPQHPLAAEVAKLISEFTGMERVAFCNTGSEAVMGAMRTALSPFTTLKAEVSTGWDMFTLQPERDTRNVRATVGFQFAPDAVISGHALVGYHAMEAKWKDYPGGAGSFSGLMASVDLTFVVVDRTQVVLRAGRDTTYSASIPSTAPPSALSCTAAVMRPDGQCEKNVPATRSPSAPGRCRAARSGGRRRGRSASTRGRAVRGSRSGTVGTAPPRPPRRPGTTR